MEGGSIDGEEEKNKNNTEVQSKVEMRSANLHAMSSEEISILIYFLVCDVFICDEARSCVMMDTHLISKCAAEQGFNVEI